MPPPAGRSKGARLLCDRMCKILLGKKEKQVPLDPQNIPRHIAIVMDGNGRWAQKRGLPRKAGHSAGSETFHKAATILAELGVEHLTVYAFSTENWKRPPDEVQEIMNLLERYLKKSVRELTENNIQLDFWGDLTPFSPKLRQLIAQTDEISKQCTGIHVHICLNYDGRDEILRGARALAQDCLAGKLLPEQIDEKALEARMDCRGVPAPDLLIRPGGELRISNFLLWECAYSEFYFTDTLWPDFDETELRRAVAAYQGRQRRFGGLK